MGDGPGDTPYWVTGVAVKVTGGANGIVAKHDCDLCGRGHDGKGGDGDDVDAAPGECAVWYCTSVQGE